jgi:hypothetical protein
VPQGEAVLALAALGPTLRSLSVLEASGGTQSPDLFQQLGRVRGAAERASLCLHIVSVLPAICRGAWDGGMMVLHRWWGNRADPLDETQSPDLFQQLGRVRGGHRPKEDLLRSPAIRIVNSR